MLNINLIVAIIGGTITISSFFITRYLERKKEIEFEIRIKKIPIYEEFLSFYFKVILGDKNGKKISHTETVIFFRELHQKVIVWFPENVLKLYIDWKSKLQEYSENSDESILKELLLIQEQLMKEIREDIGHTNKKIKKGDLSSLYINDIKKYLE